MCSKVNDLPLFFECEFAFLATQNLVVMKLEIEPQWISS